MAHKKKEQATSTELRGGAGFTFEDMVVAYSLVALLREEGAAGQNGIVTSVAVQQVPDHPMDDVVVEFTEQTSVGRWTFRSSVRCGLAPRPRTPGFAYKPPA